MRGIGVVALVVGLMLTALPPTAANHEPHFFNDLNTDASGNALDIDWVEVRNRYRFISFWIRWNRKTMRDGDGVDVLINADRGESGPDHTGDAEYLIEVIDKNGQGNRVIRISRWNGQNYEETGRRGRKLRLTLISKRIHIRVHNSKLKGTKNFWFWVGTAYPADASNYGDVTPNGDGLYGYSFDREAPQVAVLRGRSQCYRPCRAGAPVELRWKFTNPESLFKPKYLIYSSRSRKPVKVLRQGWTYRQPRTTYSIDWSMPRAPKGFLRWCVRVKDWAGNQSKKGDCDKIRLPKIPHRGDLNGYTSGPGITVSKLSLSRLPKATRVTFDCAQGCGYHEARKGRGTVKSKVFQGKRLPVGAVVVARGRHPRWVGYYAKWTVQEEGVSKVERCIAPGGKRPARRCG